MRLHLLNRTSYGCPHVAAGWPIHTSNEFWRENGDQHIAQRAFMIAKRARASDFVGPPTHGAVR